MPEATEIIPKAYRKTFVSCRAQGHEWQHIPTLADHPNFRFIKGLQSECLGCGTVRTRWIHANGRRFGIRYEYPETYQLSKKKNPSMIRVPVMREWREKYVRTLGFREEDLNKEKKSNGGNASRNNVA